MAEAPRSARRLQWALGALGSIAVGAIPIFALIVIDDATRASNELTGDVPFAAFAAAVLLPVLGFGACIGTALVPRGVAERGRARDFAGATALTCAGLLLVIPSALFCFSAPVGLLALGGAGLLFGRSRRPKDTLTAPRRV